MPFGTPVPPSPDTSAALLAAFAERGIVFVPGRRVSSLDPARGVAVLDDGTELPYDLFLGVPKHRAPDVVLESGMAEDGYVPVDSRTLETRFPGVYAVGDVATVGVPKAGVFSEGAARVVAASLVARLRGGERRAAYDGRGSCYIEFGAGRVGRVDVDFLSGPKPTGTFQEPSLDARRREAALRREPPGALVQPLTLARERATFRVTPAWLWSSPASPTGRSCSSRSCARPARPVPAASGRTCSTSGRAPASTSSARWPRTSPTSSSDTSRCTRGAPISAPSR